MRSTHPSPPPSTSAQDSPHARGAPPARSAPPQTLRAVPRFGIVMASLLAVAAFPQSAVFLVDRIDVIGAVTLSPASVTALAGVDRGQRLFSVRAADLVRRLRAHPRVKAAGVQLRPPDAVVITIAERRPVIALRVGDRIALLDDELVVVALARSSAGLPEVEDRTGRAVIVARAGVAAPSEGARLALAALAAAPRALRDDIAKIRVAAGPDLVLTTRAGLEIRAGGLAGLAERLVQVPAVLQALSGRGVAPAAIDLRYAGSVVVSPALEDVTGGDGR